MSFALGHNACYLWKFATVSKTISEGSEVKPSLFTAPCNKQQHSLLIEGDFFWKSVMILCQDKLQVFILRYF